MFRLLVVFANQIFPLLVQVFLSKLLGPREQKWLRSSVACLKYYRNHVLNCRKLCFNEENHFSMTSQSFFIFSPTS